MCERFGLSDRCIAYIGSGMLTDLKLMTENDRSIIIDKSKVRRMRSKARKENRIIERFSSLYFDGKKNNTLMKNGRIKKQEHYTLISEPSSNNICHTFPINGTSNAIAESIKSVINELPNALKVIGCDGTNVNVGRFNGVISRLERHINKNLQWIVSKNLLFVLNYDK